MILSSFAFQPNPSYPCFGESKRIYLEAPSFSGTAGTAESAVQEAVDAGANRIDPDQPSQPSPHSSTNSEQSASSDENNIPQKQTKITSSGPIPVITESNSKLRNLLGLTVFLPIEAGIRATNLAINSVMKGGKAVWKGLKFTVPPLAGFTKDRLLVGTPESRSQDHPGFGAPLNALYYGGALNMKRLAISVPQIIQNTRSSIMGSLETTGALGAKIGSWITAFTQGITTKPVAWATSKVPLLNKATQGLDNIIQNTRQNISSTGRILWEYAKLDFRNIIENTRAAIANIKGILLSPLEASLRFGTGLIGPGADTTAGQSISTTRAKIQKSKVLLKALNPFQREKNFATLVA